MPELLLAIGIGYLLGSIPFAYLVARAWGVDIFTVGTRNPGAANVYRQVGPLPGSIVFLLDTTKAAVAVVMATFILSAHPFILSASEGSAWPSFTLPPQGEVLDGGTTLFPVIPAHAGIQWSSANPAVPAAPLHSVIPADAGIHVASLNLAAGDTAVPPELLILPGLAAILGHWFPVFLRFRGGAGLASAIGASLAMLPIAGTAAIAAGLLFQWRFKSSGHSALVGLVVFLGIGIGMGEWTMALAATSAFAAVFGYYLVANRLTGRRV